MSRSLKIPYKLIRLKPFEFPQNSLKFREQL